jgi:hypothetical protein
MTEVIRNCEFRIKCPKSWDSLELTLNPRQRLCHECKRLVHHCRTPEELQMAIESDECVAINVLNADESDFPSTVGQVSAPYNLK